MPASRDHLARYAAKRLGSALPVLVVVSILAFSLVRLVPGDTVTVVLGARYEEAEAERLRARYGLDRPLPEQYLRWLAQVVRGDLGESAFSGRPVAAMIGDRLPVTLQLAGGSLLLALALAVPLGVLAAARRGRPLDYAAQAVGLLGLSIPNFWLGTVLILAFSLTFGWLPSSGFVPFAEDPWANLRHMLLPVIALGLAVAAVLLRMTRSAMLEVMHRDYMELAQAKGVGPWRRLWVHALKNAAVPVLTIAGLQAGYLLGGSVVIESVFGLPGLGLLALQAINNRDYVLLQGVILFVAFAFILINLLIDLLYALLDPRIRY